jgi:hypothetical protein
MKNENVMRTGQNGLSFVGEGAPLGRGVTLPSNIYNVFFCDISLISRE